MSHLGGIGYPEDNFPEDSLKDLPQGVPCAFMASLPDGTVLRADNAFLCWTGYQGEQAAPVDHFLDLLSSGGRSFHGSYHAAQLHPQGLISEVPVDLRFTQGTLLPVLITSAKKTDGSGKLRHIWSASFNMSAYRQCERELLLARQRAEYLPRHGALTTLPDRMLLQERLAMLAAAPEGEPAGHALLFLDLAPFSEVNDSVDRSTDDPLPEDAGDRLRSCVRPGRMTAHQEGHEFFILLRDRPVILTVSRIADTLLAALGQPFPVEGQHVDRSGGIDLSMYPRDDHDVQALLRHANTAWYEPSPQGRKRCGIEDKIRHALAEDRLVLHYQPKIAIENGGLTGAEALVRLRDRNGGLLPPAAFITAAEECGLIVEIGAWALREACRQNRAWQDAGHAPFPVAVNVSASQFRLCSFVPLVARILEETGLNGAWLELELTESAAMQDSGLTVAALHLIKRMGVRLAIDDFGTGYSSLDYLKRFQIDTLKIDKSFIHDIATSHHNDVIVESIINMAHKLDLEIVAEGVESIQQIESLRRWGCQEGQGFYFSQPLPAERFEQEILRKNQILRSTTLDAAHLRPDSF